MATVVLVQALPRIAATGATTAIRLAGGGSAGVPYRQLGFDDWRSGVAVPLRFSSLLGFDQTGWTGGALPQVGAIRFMPSDRALLTLLAGLNWNRARITVSSGDDEALAPTYPVLLTGSVASAKVEGGALVLTVADLSVDLDKPVLPDTFAGTGGLEGGDDAIGRVKRRTWGYAFNVEGRVLDKAFNVYEFSDPNRQLNSFPMVKDKGREASTYVDVAWQGSAAATLTTLRNTAAPSGGCVRAPSIACVKWWTVPAGPLTADIKGEVGAGYVETAASIAQRIVGVYSTDITLANVTEANGWQPGACGVHCGEASEKVGDLLDRLLSPIRLAWILGGDGALTFRRFVWTPSTETLRAETIDCEETFQPLKTRRLGYQRNYREHTDAEISAALLLATDAAYADGTAIEALKPVEPAADVTQITTGPAAASIARSYDGTPKSGELPREFGFKTIRGGVDVTLQPGTTFSAAVVVGTGSASFSFSSPGVLKVTAASDGVQIAVTGTVGTKSTRATPLTLSSVVDPPPSSGGTGGGGAGTTASTSNIADSLSNTYGTANTSVLQAVAGSGGKVNLTFPGKFRISPFGQTDAYGKWQWRPVGGTFADVATEIMSTSQAKHVDESYGDPSYSLPGDIAVSQSKTGLTSGTTYEFQLLLRASTNVTLTWTGTATASGA